MNTVKIGLCGLGTVGSGTFNVISRNLSEISARAGCDIQIVQLGARRDNPACDLSQVNITRDIFEVVNNPDVDVVVELIGGTSVAKDLVMKAIENGKHVVTANKALIAEFGNEIAQLAEAKQVSVGYEAAVAGGIPIIGAMREGLSANKIEWLAGIINGTGNFILTEMRDKGRDFADVLKEAQALGYAEADPTFDVEGIDAAHKLVILASLAFGMPLQFDGVYCEGISQISTDDVNYALELGYQIKHLGVARRQTNNGIELRVHPTLIPSSRLIANVDGVSNAVVVKGDAVGTTLYYGPGAGSEPTASAVVSDIVAVCRHIANGSDTFKPLLGQSFESLDPPNILPIEHVETSYYLRLQAEDKPGVLSDITQILSNSSISIDALVQKEPAQGEVSVPVILLTNKVLEANMNRAVEQIEALPSISNGVVRIRVESLN